VPTLVLALLASPVLARSLAAPGASPPVTCEHVPYGTPESAAAATPPEAGPQAPPNPDGPTLLGMAVFVHKLMGIDALASSYQFRGYVRTAWCDPRLSFDPTREGREERVYLRDAVPGIFERIWFPDAFPVNGAGPIEVTERVLRIRHDGSVFQDIQFSLAVAANYDFERFPFDEQRLTLEVESFTWNRDQLRLVPDPMRTGFSEAFTLADWRILEVTSGSEEVDVLRADTPFSRYTLEIRIAREPGFYLWKVILPLFIIVALSWAVFWMTDESFASRTRMSATGVLTIVAYQFVVAQDLPRVGYLTLLDQITVASFVLLAITVLQSLWVSRLKPISIERARSVDRASRWAFPIAYAAVLTLILTLNHG
jgi:hypothetical protein